MDSVSGPISALRFFVEGTGDVGLVARPTTERDGLVGGYCGLVARRARKALPAPGAVGLVARATFGVEVPVARPLETFEPGAGDWPRGNEVLGFGDAARDSPLNGLCRVLQGYRASLRIFSGCLLFLLDSGSLLLFFLCLFSLPFFLLFPLLFLLLASSLSSSFLFFVARLFLHQGQCGSK
jgi:hypothetical protein